MKGGGWGKHGLTGRPQAGESLRNCERNTFCMREAGPVRDDPIRTAVIMDHPVQHFARGLQFLAAHDDLALQICYWWTARRFRDPSFAREISWDVDLLDGYDWGSAPPGGSLLIRLGWLLKRLQVIRPEILVCYGWASVITRAAIVYGLITGTPILLYSDSTWQHPSRGWRRLARLAGLRILVRLGAGAISTGVFNREFYILHGMPPERIWAGVCPADTDMFGQAREQQADMVAGKSCLRIGFAGKLVPRKGVDELLHAVARLPEAAKWTLTIIGDGPLKPELEALSQRLGIDYMVAFHGFANTTEMPKLLAGFDVVVVPSREDYRVLVTIEAMAAGAAVVVSDATAVWGPGDLVEDGTTGLVYRSGAPAELAEQLTRLIEEPGLLAALRENGARRVQGFGPGAFACTTAAAIRARLGRSAR